MEERGVPPNPDHDFRPGTYVVQVPKDSIYRTPPPENAEIAERRRNAPTQKPARGRIKCVLLSIIILVIFSGIICGIILVVITKDDPRFRIERVRVTTKGKSRQQKHEFDITLETRNPNAHTIILFDTHGKTSLSFKDKKFAKGKFPSSKQEPKNSKDVTLTLMSSSNKKLPIEIRKSMNETNAKSPNDVEILLEVRVPVKMKFGTIDMKSKTLSMLCHFKVNNLGKNSRILCQDCDYSTRV